MDSANKTCPACCEELARRAVRCPHCGSRQPDAPLMHRGVPGRIAGGVCAAIALQLNVDPVLIRVAFVVSLALSVGLAFWVYALLWVMTPFHADGSAPFAQSVEWVKGVFSKSTPAAEAPVPDSQPQA